MKKAALIGTYRELLDIFIRERIQVVLGRISRPARHAAGWFTVRPRTRRLKRLLELVIAALGLAPGALLVLPTANAIALIRGAPFFTAGRAQPNSYPRFVGGPGEYGLGAFGR